MVRMGIMRGSGSKIFNAARFEADYHLLQESKIISLHAELVKLFQTLPYGPFQALASVVGTNQARILANEMNRECVVPDSYLNEEAPSQPVYQSSPGHSTSHPAKRRRLEAMELGGDGLMATESE